MPQLAGWFLIVVIAGAPVALVLRYFLFRLGCILADLPDQNIGKSLVAFILAVVLTVPLILGGCIVLAMLEATYPNLSGQIFYPGLVVDLAICWLLAAVVYWLVLSTSFNRGLIVSGVELLLSALAASLITAVFMVGGAGVQIWQYKAPKSELPSPRQTALVNLRPCVRPPAR